MPWYNNVTGELVSSPSDYSNRDELVYKPSIYAKEELPTWAEVYEEFYLKKQYTYNINTDNELDLYWNIPHRKYLIAIVCNQFNKMIYEDGMKDHIVEEINKSLSDNISNIRFILSPTTLTFPTLNNQPLIYTFPMPSGKHNPFITRKGVRYDISTLREVKLDALIQMNDNIGSIRYVTSDEFNKIIEIMIQPYKEYFEGDIGWKDSNGKVIEGDPSCRNCTGAGYCTK